MDQGSWGGKYKVEISVIQVVRGAAADKQAQDANMFNEEPPTGNSYIQIKLRAKYVEGDSGRKYETVDGSNQLYAQGRFYDPPSLFIETKPVFAGKQMLPGATIEGWLPAAWLEDNLSNEALLVYHEVYFKLK